MRRIAAVRPRNHVATETGGAARPPMAARATFDQSGADRPGSLDIADAVLRARTEALHESELPLEQLPSASYGPCRVACRDEGRRSRRHDIADAGANLLLQRFE